MADIIFYNHFWDFPKTFQAWVCIKCHTSSYNLISFIFMKLFCYSRITMYSFANINAIFLYYLLKWRPIKLASSYDFLSDCVNHVRRNQIPRQYSSPLMKWAGWTGRTARGSLVAPPFSARLAFRYLGQVHDTICFLLIQSLSATKIRIALFPRELWLLKNCKSKSFPGPDVFLPFLSKIISDSFQS